MHFYYFNLNNWGFMLLDYNNFFFFCNFNFWIEGLTCVKLYEFQFYKNISQKKILENFNLFTNGNVFSIFFLICIGKYFSIYFKKEKKHYYKIKILFVYARIIIIFLANCLFSQSYIFIIIIFKNQRKTLKNKFYIKIRKAQTHKN
jgi:hypothetical protein